MAAECCCSRVSPDKKAYKNRLFGNKINKCSRVWPSPIILLAALLPLSLSSTAQSYNSDATRLARSSLGKSTLDGSTRIHASQVRGWVVNAQGQPVADVTVEIRDLRGLEMGGSFTNQRGAFVIDIAAEPGEYIVLAATPSQSNEERITLVQPDLQVRIALPAAAGSCAPTLPGYSVSAAALRVPEKARKHLQSAQKEFSQGNLAAARQEIDRALQSDSRFAKAFAMRALIEVARKELRAAVQDAESAALIDPFDENAYLVLGTAHNALHEFEQAEKAEQRALSMSPNSWQAQLEMAKSLYGQDQFVLALRELDLLRRDFPDVHLVRGNVLTRLDRRTEAAEEFSMFLKEAPDDPRSGKIRQIVAGELSSPNPPNPLLR
jgi:tetratricopeptide (TPR) repeat protein